MTKVEAEAAIESKTLVAGGTDTEDYDEGYVVEIIDDERVLVAWNTGVRTPALLADLSLA
jgi:hypothetical protein